MNCERLNLHNRSINSAYEVLLYNQPGTRYFHARRHQNSWYDDKGNYMPFGGGSEWTLQGSIKETHPFSSILYRIKSCLRSSVILFLLISDI